VVVDVHAHLFPPKVVDFFRDRGGNAVGVFEKDGVQGITYDGKVLHARLPREIVDIEAQLAGMDRLGVTARMLSVPPPMVYWATGSEGLALTRVTNDALGDVAARWPDRFVPMAAVPLQDPVVAAAELRRLAREDGYRVVGIGSNINGSELDAPALEPFFEAAADEDVAIFVHPMLAPDGGARLKDYRLDLGLGMVSETTIAAARLISSGRLDRYPGLRICWSHLGGLLPFVGDRIEYYVSHVPGVLSHAERPFTDYFQDFWFDLTIYSERMLRAGLAIADPAKLVFGTDAPFNGDSTSDIRAVLDASPSLTDQQRHAIYLENPARFLGGVAPWSTAAHS
jgi:aminocarboxymuconate-semialdehyde decarboxylase